MRIIIFAIILCTSILTVGLWTTTEAQTIETVSYCDLMRQPAQYNGKVIRVSAIYRYGFEWSTLYCPECIDETQTWIGFSETFISSTKRSLRKKIGENGFRGKTVKVKLVGRFDGGGGYGHMGVYKYRIIVDRLEEAEVILKDSPSPNVVPKEVLQRMHCQ
jgi:hypothetical protein